MNHCILPGISRNHEFMGKASPYIPTIRLHRPEAKTTPREYPDVGIEHLPVAFFRAFFVGVKTVGIFHAELPGPHDTESRSYFITKFCLNLIEIPGKLAVCLYLIAHQRGYHLFMRRPYTVISVVPVPDPQQFFPIHVPASRFHPEFGWLHGRHKYLLCPRPVHLFTNNIFHLPDHTITQWQVRVYPPGQFSYHSCPQHKLVARDLRVRRSFLCGR